MINLPRNSKTILTAFAVVSLSLSMTSQTKASAAQKKGVNSPSVPVKQKPPQDDAANKDQPNQSDQKDQKDQKIEKDEKKPNDQDEYYEIQTPFGTQRVKRTPGMQPAGQNVQKNTAPATGQGASPGASPSPSQTSPAQGVAADGSQVTPAEQQAQPTAPSEDQAVQAAPRVGGKLRLNLHADLLQVINIIGNELKLNYVVDPRVKGTVTINTAGEFKRSDLLPLLETILQVNGAALIKTGNLYQIVPGPAAKGWPVPIRAQGQEGELGTSNGMVMQVIPMQVVLAKDMAEILKSYLSEEGNMVVHETGNILIITENGSNLKRLMELVAIFDSDVFQGQRVQLYPIRNNSSKNIVTDLESIFMGYALSSKGSAIKFISIDRINAILAISSNPKSFAEVQKWIEKLDKPVENVGIKNYFYKVQNGDAKKMSKVLLEIYGHKQEEEEPATPGALPPQGSPSGQPESPKTPPEKEKNPAALVQGDINIVADEVNNALIIRASPQDYEVIKETIQELDIVPRQVLIDAKIYEVSLTGELSMGVSYFLQNRNNPIVPAPPGTVASFSASKVGNVGAGLNISTFTVIGQTRELVAFLNAQESRGKTRVLSSPSVIASDNLDARIQVGAEVPLLTSQGVVSGAQAGGNSLFSNTIQQRPTGVILDVTPRINASGWVTMKINQEVSAPVAPAAGSGIQSPSINIRSVKTQITIKDGETIAIGGIISENKLLSKNRVPLLGDIPGLGLVFGNTSYTTTRTELIALITPHVIEDIERADEATEGLKTSLKAIRKDLKKIERSYE
jgi:general secretion pathway protein D